MHDRHGRRSWPAMLFVAALAWAGSAPAGEPFPARQPVRLIVVFAPGGGADAIARTINGKLGEALKQTVIVENRPGAGGALATDLVAKAPSDGYTVLFSTSSHSINQALYPHLPFDTARDLRGVTLIARAPQVLVVHPSVPASTVQEWLALGKRDPAYAVYGSGGVGSPGHLAGALFTSLAHVQFRHIPYKGAGPALADTMANQVPALFATMSGALPHIRAGKLKALAVTSAQRAPGLPDVPTIAEAGFPGYEADTWFGTFVPRATPDAVVETLHQATLKALRDPALKSQLDLHAAQVVGDPPKVLDAVVAREIRSLTALVREHRIRPE